MFVGVPAIDTHVNIYCDHLKEDNSNVIHAHLEYILGHFQAK